MSAPGDGAPEPPFLYLATTGWKTGRPHEIEIWYGRLDDRYYLISELGERAHWVQNLRREPRVSFRLGDERLAGLARVLDPELEPGQTARVRALFEARYAWSEGLIVELTPGTTR